MYMDSIKPVTKEKKNYAIDAIISMVVDDLAAEFDENPNNVLKNFINSNTGKLLYDDESGCWKNGPAYIEDLYKDELKRMGKL